MHSRQSFISTFTAKASLFSMAKLYSRRAPWPKLALTDQRLEDRHLEDKLPRLTDQRLHALKGWKACSHTRKAYTYHSSSMLRRFILNPQNFLLADLPLVVPNAPHGFECSSQFCPLRSNALLAISSLVVLRTPFGSVFLELQMKIHLPCIKVGREYYPYYRP